MFCFIFVQGLKKPKSNLPLQNYSQDHKATVPSFLEPWIQYHDFRHRGLQLRIRIPIQNGRSEKACMALLCEHVFHAGELCSALHSALNFIGKGLMSYALQCESIAWKACPSVAAPLPSSSFEPWLRSLIRLTNVAKEHSFGTGGVHWWTCNLKILKFVQGKPRSNCGPYRDVQIGMEPSHFLVQHDFGGNNPFCTIYMCPACISAIGLSLSISLSVGTCRKKETNAFPLRLLHWRVQNLIWGCMLRQCLVGPKHTSTNRKDTWHNLCFKSHLFTTPRG